VCVPVECLFLYDDADFLFITTLLFITALMFMTTLSFFSRMFERCVFPGQWTPPGLGKVIRGMRCGFKSCFDDL
jgi:hypothetical protein